MMRFLPIVFMRYRKRPKITTLVTFGFSSLPLSLLSGARYFQVSKTCTPHGPFLLNEKDATGILKRTEYFLKTK